MSSHQLTDVYEQLRFVLAGNAKFTLVSLKSGKRFTYRARRAKDAVGREQPLIFIAVLTGPDNKTAYSYLGFIRDEKQHVVEYHYGIKSKLGHKALSAIAFDWWFHHMGHSQVEFYHEGHCARCGRTLTVPASIERGIGPECANIMGL